MASGASDTAREKGEDVDLTIWGACEFAVYSPQYAGYSGGGRTFFAFCSRHFSEGKFGGEWRDQTSLLSGLAWPPAIGMPSRKTKAESSWRSFHVVWAVNGVQLAPWDSTRRRPVCSGIFDQPPTPTSARDR